MSYPVYLCVEKTTTGDSEILDALAAHQAAVPFVLHVNITSSVNYTVKGSHDRARWQDYFTGAANAARDLVIGVRWWKITVNTISGTITAGVGAVPDRSGRNVLPTLYSVGSSPVV